MDIAILGYGVVGSGAAQLLRQNNASITARSLQPSMRLKYILDIRDFPGDPCESLIVHDMDIIINDPDVGIVAETIGGLHPAFDFVKACLKKGKSVVTSNKELVAVKGYELMQIARAHNANFLFEASVGGGIPIIRPLSQCLAGNVVSEVAGILNGTTNFILTKMINESMPFEAALRIAQKNGYAEKDPTADIEGLDACRKICILATLAFGKHILPGQVRTEGISGVSIEDVLYAADGGCRIKLLGRARLAPDGHITAVVGPMLVPMSNLLANVNDVYNAIMIHGDAVEDVIFYGRGAGKFPTASAVVGDIIDCAKHTVRRRFFDWEEGDPGFVAPADEEVTKLYVRALGVYAPGLDAEAAWNAVRLAMPGAKRLCRGDAPEGELAFITPAMPEKEARAALTKMAGLDVKAVMRVY